MPIAGTESEPASFVQTPESALAGAIDRNESLLPQVSFAGSASVSALPELCCA
ncbi:MAG TPA: hypothetical protein VJV79_36935 [Polyangiaceae bacterium]|nr:hypothetical protein [Polyangiaceae bacterium]